MVPSALPDGQCQLVVANTLSNPLEGIATMPPIGWRPAGTWYCRGCWSARPKKLPRRMPLGWKWMYGAPVKAGCACMAGVPPSTCYDSRYGFVYALPAMRHYVFG